MDASLLKELIGKGKPVRVETASGEAYEIRNRDCVAFSPKYTTMVVLYKDNGEDHFALLPLLTITAATVQSD
jgi:hypothetical protein